MKSHLNLLLQNFRFQQQYGKRLKENHTINHRTFITMEKYIFDCRQDQDQPPKYLKRNHKVNNLPILQSAQAQYLKNKVFLTFDYSYYQTVPKTASLYVGNRVKDLNYLVEFCEPAKEKTQGDQRQVPSSFPESSKWKTDKQNRAGNNEKHQRQSVKYMKKKIRMPVESMPGVGDYYYEPSSIQKRIVYDVKIRGKPSVIGRQGQIKTESGQNEKAHLSKTMYIGEKKSEKSSNALAREQKYNRKKHESQEQYSKFIESIETANVWSRLMEKYKLKGSKFDVSGYGS